VAEIQSAVMRLEIRRTSQLLMEGASSPIEGALRIADKDRFRSVAAEAKAWVRQAIEQVKAAPDNPWGDNDEAIAQGLLVQAGLEPDSSGSQGEGGGKCG